MLMKVLVLRRGFLIAALHNAGLVCLTHTPNPMKFLNSMCKRPANEKPIMILPVGYASEAATIPEASTNKKPLRDIMSIFWSEFYLPQILTGPQSKCTKFDLLYLPTPPDLHAWAALANCLTERVPSLTSAAWPVMWREFLDTDLDCLRSIAWF